MSSSEPAPSSLSSAEIVVAIRTLSDADRLRLRKIAAALCRGRPLDWEDLLQEAFRRALNGDRKCPRSVDAVRFLAETMRSIASDSLKAQRRQPPLHSLPATGENHPVFDLPDPRPTQEEQLIHEQEVTRIKRDVLKHFQDDEIAQIIVEGTMEGTDGEELRSVTDLDKTAFASKRRLIRRRIDKAFPGGWKT